MQVTYKKRYVKNIGNYESLAVEIGIEDEVNYETGDKFEECYIRLRETVNLKLKKEFSKI